MSSPNVKNLTKLKLDVWGLRTQWVKILTRKLENLVDQLDTLEETENLYGDDIVDFQPPEPQVGSIDYNINSLCEKTNSQKNLELYQFQVQQISKFNLYLEPRVIESNLIDSISTCWNSSHSTFTCCKFQQ